MISADDDLDAGPEYCPGLGVGEHAGAEGVPAAQITPALRMLRTVGAHGVIREVEVVTGSAFATGTGAPRGSNHPVLAKARTPIPSSGASTMSVRKPFQMPS